MECVAQSGYDSCVTELQDRLLASDPTWPLLLGAGQAGGDGDGGGGGSPVGAIVGAVVGGGCSARVARCAASAAGLSSRQRSC